MLSLSLSPVVYVEEPIYRQIDAQRYGHLGRIVRRYDLVERRQNGHHIGNVNKFVVLRP